MNVYNGIFECNVMVYSKRLSELGVDNESWIREAIDLNEVSSVRQDIADNGEVLDAYCAIQLKGEDACHIIDIPYEDFLIEWINNKSK